MVSEKDSRFNDQLVLVRAAFHDDPVGLTWGELRSRLEDLAAERIARASRNRPDLEATSDPATRKKWLREEAGRWSAKAPTASQLRHLLACLIEGGEVRVKPKLGPETPETRYVSVAAEAWWQGLKTGLRGPFIQERDPDAAVLSGVVKDLPILVPEAGIGLDPESEYAEWLRNHKIR
jgi:hypothetical protein